MESFTLRGLTFSYPDAATPALDGISLSLGQGQFVVLCGPSGCGKSTLLRQLKPALTPHGNRTGEIFFETRALHELDQREQSCKIGFVMQNPENQIVTDKVWHELAFGLESLGYEQHTIRRRVAEMAAFFGIESWFYKDVSELSGGQKQLLNLASVMAMQPSVIILDEPTSQLDPIAAAEFLSAIGRINRELGTSIIITEHRLEEVFPFADRVLVMDKGRMICDGSPSYVGEHLKGINHNMFLAMPTPMRVYSRIKSDLPCPVTIAQGRRWIDDVVALRGALPVMSDEEVRTKHAETVIEMNEVWFRYEKNTPDVLKGFSQKVSRGEFLAILGGNGAGKSTALSLMSGRKKPYRGSVKICGVPIEKSKDLYSGKLGVLPQNPQALFLKKTVREDLLEMLVSKDIAKEERESKLKQVASLCRLSDVLHMHPYDLSGGEQQRAALAKVLLTEPEILMLDEPTKGFDAGFKLAFAGILKDLISKGVTLVMVSHDVEFCAKYAHRCALVFDGMIVSTATPRKFFSQNSFYTTSANRMARHILPEAVTAEDIIKALLEDDEGCGAFDDGYEPPDGTYGQGERGPDGSDAEDSDVCDERGDSGDADGSGGFGGSDGKAQAKTVTAHGAPAVQERTVPKRTVAAVVIALIAIPLTIFTGMHYLDDRQYYMISMMIILETMLPFVMVFEGKKPQARELVILSVLCAIGVAGRMAFFMLPQFKPVVAIAIIAGVSFGGEAGFLFGAVTGFVSNFFYGQGPWTPWQMFAYGITGFLAGLLFCRGILRRDKKALCVFGGLAAFVIYGGIMNSASVLIFQETPTKEMFIASYLLGVPFDLIHAVATVFFLWIIADPFIQKLDRIKLKYGLLHSSSVSKAKM